MKLVTQVTVEGQTEGLKGRRSPPAHPPKKTNSQLWYTWYRLRLTTKTHLMEQIIILIPTGNKTKDMKVILTAEWFKGVLCLEGVCRRLLCNICTAVVEHGDFWLERVVLMNESREKHYYVNKDHVEVVFKKAPVHYWNRLNMQDDVLQSFLNVQEK